MDFLCPTSAQTLANYRSCAILRGSGMSKSAFEAHKSERVGHTGFSKGVYSMDFTARGIFCGCIIMCGAQLGEDT